MREFLERYRERFGENFPTFACRGYDEDEIVAIIKKCLEEGKPYKLVDGREY